MFKNEIRLCGISYKFNKERNLSGLQLHFSNGTESPVVETKVVSTKEWQRADIDPADVANTVEFYVVNENSKFSIQALRLRDKYGVSM